MVIGYDTGIWRLFLGEDGDHYLCFGGMLGERHDTEEQAMELIKRNIDDDLRHENEKNTLEEGFVQMYFLSKLEKEDQDSTTYITMTAYVSHTYGEEVLAALREYDETHKINLKVL